MRAFNLRSTWWIGGMPHRVGELEEGRTEFYSGPENIAIESSVI